MKTAVTRYLLAALVFTIADPLFAPFISQPIVDVNQFKITVYSQTNSAPPAAGGDFHKHSGQHAAIWRSL
jgi:hypothetical protein